MRVLASTVDGAARAQLWGERDREAVENFPVSGPADPGAGDPLARADQGRRGAGRRAELGGLDADLAERIAAAGDAVGAGDHDDQFPVDVFRTGSGDLVEHERGEVIANLAGDGAHANDHVSMGPVSNDVFPSAVHLAALGEVSADPGPAPSTSSPSRSPARPTSSRGT